ncbi:hypothetical protein [Methylobacterium tardum]|uniref:hypothetical protein n=1 Tax=Methylobacterium tardum TaxID=374432 RepID=UPI003617889C
MTPAVIGKTAGQRASAQTTAQETATIPASFGATRGRIDPRRVNSRVSRLGRVRTIIGLSRLERRRPALPPARRQETSP